MTAPRGALHLFRFGIVNAEGVDSDLLHCLAVDGLIVSAGHAGRDLIDILHTLYDLAERGILARRDGVHPHA